MTDKTNYEMAQFEASLIDEERMSVAEMSFRMANAQRLATLALVDAVREQTEADAVRNNALAEIQEAKRLLAEIKKEMDSMDEDGYFFYPRCPLEKLLELWNV